MSLTVDRKINIATIVTLSGLLLAGASAFYDHDKRISLNEQSINGMKSDLTQTRTELREDMKEVIKKLDHLIQREMDK